MKKLYTTIAFTLLSGILFAQLRIYTPSLTGPADNATGLNPATVLDWGAVTGSSFDVTYQMLLDTDPGFSNPTIVNTDITSYKTSNLLFNTWYHWKVRAWDDTDTSAWSPMRSFKILNAVVLDKPNNNSENQNPNVTVSWDSIPGVTKYQIQYDTTYFLTEVATEFEENLLGVDVVNENLAWLVGESGTVGKYENETWSMIDIGTSEDLYSVHFSEESRGAIAGDGGAVFIYDGTTWEDISIADASDPVTGIWLSSALVYAATEAGDIYIFDGTDWALSHSASADLFDIEFTEGGIGWAVGADGSIYYFDGSTWTDQSIANADDINSIEILSENNAWVAGGSGEFYHYDGTEWSMAASNEEEDVFSLVMLDENTGYAVGEAFYIYDGELWNVNTTGVNLELSAISLSNNGNGWAVGEEGIVMDFGSNSFNSPLAEIRTYNSPVPEHPLSLLPFGEEIFWRVRAIHPQDTSGWSAVGNFSTFSQIQLSKPDNGSEQPLLVKLRWNAKTGINGYEIHVSDNENFNDPHYYFIDSVSIFLEDLGFGETYYWRGRAVHNNDTSAWSQVYNFNTIDEVYLSTPQNGATEVSLTPSLRYNKIVNVPRYQIQLSDTPEFDSLIHNSIAQDTNASQVISKLEHNTTYYWRARAIIIAPDTSGWSEVWQFTTLEPAGINVDDAFDALLTMYPNPGNGQLSIEYSGEQSEIHLKVIDLVGKVMVERKLNFNSAQNKQSINLQNLAEGVYLIKLQKNNESITRKLVIRK